MDAKRNHNGVWKWISGILASVLMTGLVSWATFGQDRITKAEAKDMMDQRFPRDMYERVIKIEKDVEFIKDNFWRKRNE